MSPAELARRIAALDWSATSLQHQLAVSAACATLKGFEPMQTNVVQLPVRPRTCWTTLCHLDGREWARSSHFGPGGAWNWILDAVQEEHGVNEDQIGCIETDDGDVVTIDGEPIYRIEHISTISANNC